MLLDVYSLQAIADENKSILLIIEKYMTMSTISLILIERLYIAWEDYKSSREKVYTHIYTNSNIRNDIIKQFLQH